MTAYVACLRCGGRMIPGSCSLKEARGTLPVHLCEDPECSYYLLSIFPSFIAEKFLSKRNLVVQQL